MRKETEEAFKGLDRYEREAKAGAPDAWLAREVDTSVAMVKRWRKANGIRRRGKVARVDAERFAVSLLGRKVPDVLLRANQSLVDGAWMPPEFILRGEVDYRQLCLQLGYLYQEGGFTVEQLAKAHGYTERTVDQALALYERMLET